MGGAKSTSGKQGGKFAPETISSTMKIGGNTFVINDDEVTSPSGNKFKVTEVREISKDNKRALEAARKAGFEDPVFASSNAITERKVAEKALEQKKQASANYKENMRKNVSGYDEIEKARSHNASERSKYRQSIERGDTIIYTPKYENVSALEKAYPRATAYLKAEGYAASENYMKAAYGREAMTEIRQGKSYKEAISNMEKKWNDYTASRAWD